MTSLGTLPPAVPGTPPASRSLGDELLLRLPVVPRLLRGLSRPHRRRLARLALDRQCAVARRLLPSLATSGGGSPERALVITGAVVTLGEVLVARVGDARTGASAGILKLAAAPEARRSLAHHRSATGRVHELTGLPAVQALVPRTLAWGCHEGQAYVFETLLDGVAASEAVVGAAAWARLRRSAAAALLSLQARTLERRVVDEAGFHWLAGGALRRLDALAASWPAAARLRRQLAHVERQLGDALLGRELPLTWGHGDFWPGNLLVRAPDAPAVSGIVDWDRAASRTMPLHDLLHLLAYVRKLQRSGALGEQVVRLLRPAPFDAEEAALVDEARERLGAEDDRALLRATVLAYWLRVVTLHLQRYPAFQADGGWLRQNVFPVLTEAAR